MSVPDLPLTFHPLTPERWPDLERLFGPRGACGGCWCMVWRLRRADFVNGKGEGNRRAFQAVVAAGDPPGVLAYHGEERVGWCAVAPREAYPALGRSRVCAPVDDRPVWSISCLFVARPYRRRGVSARLLAEAARFAVERGARVVEGYPVDPKQATAPAAFVWTGLPSAFRRAGFREVLRRSPTRPIMRLEADAPPARRGGKKRGP
jgi:GNAT superfamily N-acetyltransferase